MDVLACKEQIEKKKNVLRTSGEGGQKSVWSVQCYCIKCMNKQTWTTGGGETRGEKKGKKKSTRGGPVGKEREGP